MRRIDLNADLGEGMGDDAAMLGIVTSANVACGAHAGDAGTMRATLLEAARQGVVIGAHPGYADRANFGRVVVPMSFGAITEMVAGQVAALWAIAADVGARVSYVKAHGALANLAAADADVARAVLGATDLPILAISGTVLEMEARKAGRVVFSEVFADRAYLRTGQLVPRSRADAMILEPAAATGRLVVFLKTGLMPVVDGDAIPLAAESICVHGDSAHAVGMAGALRRALMDSGVTLAPFIAGQ